MNTSNYEYPISTDRLAFWIPHRPPMVWIDEVVVTTSIDGTCRLTLQPHAYYWDGAEVRGTSVLEFMAQAYAYVSVVIKLRELCELAEAPQLSPLKRAFLVSVRDAEMPKPEKLKTLKVGDTLMVKVFGFRNFGPITNFQGEVRNGRDELIASAQLKVFSDT
jgi:predicted hotdog family 3-hydroxylacyl-ACP dehydratase